MSNNRRAHHRVDPHRQARFHHHHQADLFHHRRPKVKQTTKEAANGYNYSNNKDKVIAYKLAQVVVYIENRKTEWPQCD